MSQTQSEQITPSEFIKLPYLRVLTYPALNLRVARSRVSQLEKLGIKNIIFEGKTRIGRLGLLGMGTVSLVVKTGTEGRVFALKIRRTDSNRESMDAEARLTQLANRVSVGPMLLKSTKDLLLMQYVEGVEIDAKLRALHGKGTRGEVRKIIHLLLNQCRKLDIIGLDHGQLSNLRKHVIISEGVPYMLDFESASTGRAPRNVTSAAQYLFVGGRISSLVRRILGMKETEPVVKSLRDYKREMDDVAYARLLRTIGISSPGL